MAHPKWWAVERERNVNRTAVRTGGDAEGELTPEGLWPPAEGGSGAERNVNLRTHTYAADLLNLYQQRAGVLNTADIMGSAPVDTAVQVNGQSATRQGEYFHAEVSADTTAASRLEPVLVAAVRPAAGPNGEGLVATPDHTPCFPTYDGNVTTVITTSATEAARYTYSPFGITLALHGPLAPTSLYRFSTKYLDPETTLLYYGYHYYQPNVGRWLNRDPIEEKGGINMAEYVNNDPVHTLTLAVATSFIEACRHCAG